MGREDEIVKERIKKIEALKARGLNPYSYNFNLDKDAVADLQTKHTNLKNEEFAKEKAIVAGRIMSIRDMGKIAFIKLQDKTGFMQIVLRDEDTPKELFEFLKLLDEGDIIGAEGKIFRTKRGELSILAQKLTILTKSIFPLPDKFQGLKDEEEKLRKRYLDIIMNPEIKELFIKKQKFWGTVRSFLANKGFLEVETPVLESSAGGAAATPFKTHHNALNLDIFLRISQGELWQKKLLVAGYEKTFEIGRLFRNEGMDAEHLQDYTSMEFYWAYADYKDGMKLVEEMYKEVSKVVLGGLKFQKGEFEVDLGKKWETYDYEKLIEEKTKINIYKTDKKDIQKRLTELHLEFDINVDKWRLVDILWKYCRKQLVGPGFLVGQPVELAPLAKRSRLDPKKVEQFQVIIAGSEMGNGYSELNDPADQEERFKEQQSKKDSGDSEGMAHDFEFVEALKYGMPPACGFGVSERFFSFLMNKPIRETVIFPLMRPSVSSGQKEEVTQETKKEKVAEIKKSIDKKETKKKK